MTGLALGLLAGSGVYLVMSSTGPRQAAHRRARSAQARMTDWLAQAGLADVRPASFLATMGLLLLLGGVLGFAMFGGILPAVMAGAFASLAPPASYRARRQRRLAEAREAWPRLIEEIRIGTASLGRSIPQALLEVAANSPEPMRPAFAAAEREWRISTDFRRTVDVLQRTLADPTADAACETLLVAYEIGGSDLDRRLRALAEDRELDIQGRKDAASKQAGVRFARRFVIVVPIGMALAGMSIGTGRAAYATPTGQLAVAFGLVTVAACWMWAGHYLRLPAEERVFRGDR